MSYFNLLIRFLTLIIRLTRTALTSLRHQLFCIIRYYIILRDFSDFFGFFLNLYTAKVGNRESDNGFIPVNVPDQFEKCCKRAIILNLFLVAAR